jgi:hypothetical protein
MLELWKRGRLQRTLEGSGCTFTANGFLFTAVILHDIFPQFYNLEQESLLLGTWVVSRT